ncbi:MAG: hypothetical protein Q8764_01070 [Pigeon pea little leaf phytoplasma]|uniref:Uncharacterized protein n=1 Tax=Candidatus Phytoplasma fabacearum TaxID=2982628 RepID=A0ABU8ZSE2_9MOLU|nr:hypothetical protein ['Bituminaria bituminosa' little leaf phytoplasma]MDV3158601.1 hypothetical protein [Pigeon pea little leaf phytoplasma]MDO8023746.1 hypothetical protein ['Bituminaria bituminosa' little leaf phytoplasma]MDV3161471.1 hypothetical protein [Pigeon pea little leaf phytoplasma]MDV3195729.1 hypothetical protein [Pigeon pea little leaf phytoplasma]MDV3196890.1 hypothetical protein [Pigeon pea little leaf phytoplasma]
MQKYGDNFLESAKHPFYDPISSIMPKENSLQSINSDYEENEQLSVLSDNLLDKDLDQIKNVFEKKPSNNHLNILEKQPSNNDIKTIKKISSSKQILPRSFKSLFVTSFGLIRVCFSKIVFAFR